MAMYEFFCEQCQESFEQITRDGDPEYGKCPKCQNKNTRKLITTFKTAGRGDVRESTMNGCHDCHVPIPGEKHTCGGGCKH